MGNDQIITADMARALRTDIARTHPLFGWAIWRDAPDYPGKVIARLVTDNPTPYVLVGSTVAELRAQLPPGLERGDRRQFDLPELVEVWLVA